MSGPRARLGELAPALHGGRRAAHGVTIDHDFSVCLNAFGPSAHVVRAVRCASFDEYPDPTSLDVRRVAADAWNVTADEVVFGAGATELIQAVCLAFLGYRDTAVVVRPAFGEYERAAAVAGARIRDVAFADPVGGIDDVAVVVDTIRRVAPRLAFVATPVSPTGAVWPIPALAEIASACRDTSGLLVLDQSYDDFLDAPFGTPVLRRNPSVLHVRSLTKAHALAGLRVAFGVGAAGVIGAIERVRVPWAASTLAQAAAAAAFDHEATAHVAATTSLLRREVERLIEACRANSLACSPTRAHYTTIACGNGRVARARLIERHQILVRDCASFGFADRIRVAARTPVENDALIAALPVLCATAKEYE